MLHSESPVGKEENAQYRGHKEALANYDQDFILRVRIQTGPIMCIVLKFVFVIISCFKMFSLGKVI